MDIVTIGLLCTIAFAAGFVDAIVGGGGLIQTPASLVLLPSYPVATVIGSLKIPSFSGTAIAARQYFKRVAMNGKRLLLMCAVAAAAAFAGSQLLTVVSNRYMKPVIFIVLIIVAIYTYFKKDFGQHTHRDHSPQTVLWYSLLISVVIGFYDGFIGPGAGSFFILAFISILGFDFLQASAHAKMLNLATNFGSILLFLGKGSILWPIAIPMAICNALGGFAGAKLALKKGNRFIRIFFMIIVTATLLRFGYNIFFRNA
ncbi:hypothetical protein SAMN05444410_101120 [Hydrobacter penzbergensis]|uniref:Probable membrane transporter protein n=1 Tax=Hydrobacter penzbergensis TaxID=1235997 RepID=A0A8X8ICB0_9BACT|nr:TSUP family transporter [Hydrobacter penzbergensis]SDW05305.1 hypothetical protein SAMN05444410_101120 [Hydrobacter penzbergensis]